MFSRRTEWETSANELTEILNSRRSSGRRVIDLTVSNPTACGFRYPDDRILRALSSTDSLTYSPDPRGLPNARRAVATYYGDRGSVIPVDDIFLTASTSESYSLLFRLLCDPGDTVLVPRPTYPLFDYLATIADVRTVPYRLFFDGAWEIDTGSLLEATSESPRAIVVVDPHNPTGSFMSDRSREALHDAALRAGAALIVDEVFRDYDLRDTAGRSVERHTGPGDDTGAPLTFLLNGLSKTAALPQMKIGWIAVTGGGPSAADATSRLEILNDTYLSANTPAQAALPDLLAAGDLVRPRILERVRNNLSLLREVLGAVPGCVVLPVDGGWNAVVRLPGGISDAECTESLLREDGVYCYPGYFFDFDEDNVIILSLIVPSVEFGEGVKIVGRRIGERSGRAPR